MKYHILGPCATGYGPKAFRLNKSIFSLGVVEIWGFMTGLSGSLPW
jgi:hypothetical protein